MCCDYLLDAEKLDNIFGEMTSGANPLLANASDHVMRKICGHEKEILVFLNQGCMFIYLDVYMIHP